MSNYVLLKRTNQTVFVYADAAETVEDVKKKLASIVKHPAETIRLVGSDQKSPLEEAKTFGELKIEPETILYWVLRGENGSWEEVNVQKVEKSDADGSKAEDK
eukprot:TRINITY_DN910_c0_g1_i1.p1 TRINITY_DN910_c0_g1~~TRINITY_DN910_c0_g1_i1.p1  ORF type:complete len:103 (+),score=33.14 TRINITY_DN910_c0_g1_i1:55-363(+)